MNHTVLNLDVQSIYERRHRADDPDLSEANAGGPGTILSAKCVNHWTEGSSRAVGGIESKRDLSVSTGRLSLNSRTDGFHNGADILRPLMDILSPSPHLTLGRRHLNQQLLSRGVPGDAIHPRVLDVHSHALARGFASRCHTTG